MRFGFGRGLRQHIPLALLLCSACEGEHTLEPTVDARPGIRQLGEADGPLIDEDVACERVRDALVSAQTRNACDEVSVEDCPDLIRPAGSLACLRFSVASVNECVLSVEDYDSCRDFVAQACIVTAVVGETTEGCVPPGPEDSGTTRVDAGDDVPADDDVADDDTTADDDVADDDTTADDDVADDDAPGDDDTADDDTTADDDAGTEPADDDAADDDAGSGSSDDDVAVEDAGDAFPADASLPADDDAGLVVTPDGGSGSPDASR